MDIPRRVANLVKKYETRDPFKLADHLRIKVLRRPLDDSIHGFFIKALRRKFIIINSNHPDHIQKQSCAHELGHARLHKGWNYYFVIHHTYFAAGKFEREANDFAWCLLFDEEECKRDFCGEIDRYVRMRGIAEMRMKD